MITAYCNMVLEGEGRGGEGRGGEGRGGREGREGGKERKSSDVHGSCGYLGLKLIEQFSCHFLSLSLSLHWQYFSSWLFRC